MPAQTSKSVWQHSDEYCRTNHTCNQGYKCTNLCPPDLDLICRLALCQAEGVESWVQEAADILVAAVTLCDLSAKPEGLRGSDGEEGSNAGPFGRDL